MLRHAQIVFVPEIVANPSEFVGQSVRVLGRVSEGQHQANRLCVEYQDALLFVNTSLLDNVSFREGSLYQFIGEISSDLLLCARVSRCVDGMDLALYEKAVDIRRQFLLATGIK
mmetsp:Transcript_27038/g.46618  ORF Transcript_27038/g.46618 Transcript_27038/m.46618 type:complete len:114 (+) Transcript_27038:174-515(+)